MTKMKKLFAVVLALAMLLTMSSLSAFAEESAAVDMTVSADANNIFVNIDAGDNVGGITATLTYDKTAVKYVGFASSNDANQEVNTLKDDKNGNVAIVLLGSDLTVKFEATGATGAIEFTLKNVKASNENGTELLALAADCVTAQLQGVTTNGNTIRETQVVENQDLGFVSTFIGSAIPEDAKEIKLGFVAIPKNMLNGELNVDTTGALKAVVEIDSREDLVGEYATKYVAHIAGIADNTTRMGRVICGRFYVSYKVGDAENATIVYSDNTTKNPAVNNGVVAKSFVGTCKAMSAVILNSGADVTYTKTLTSADAVSAIITASSTPADQRVAILEFVVANAALLK